ncbi:sulfotransferase family protein [Phaeobacter gallaeciensis]|uniref:sulfotransferase n=1 Tax=Phaeobacter TaxID=302485 RepID=UPI00238060C3|nr:sulfotransferase [Phaeobacter gallaeciensis]MDE4275603.1 sulfotransferase family protein [Phaeobacter gallaeciensis]MDE4300646.1 sulfotransferase family protein [Phaeobacter gallaeciensis]MDE5185810.1 sulfotransferase family protein [Phaeobacter gallaeciensis]
MSLKVINLGLPKSGTTTLGKALSQAGYSVADHRLRDREEDKPGKRRIFVGSLLYKGLYERGDPMAYLDGFDALSEVSFIHGKFSVWPQFDFALLQVLKDLNPGLKFIATRRDAASHSKSIMAWNNLGTARLPASTVPGLPIGYGKTPEQQMIWIDGHYEALKHWFREDPDYLEINVADAGAQARVGAFLGRDLPWWGQANVNRKARS